MGSIISNLDRIPTYKGENSSSKPAEVAIAIANSDKKRPLAIGLGHMSKDDPRSFDLSGLRVYSEGLSDNNHTPTKSLEIEAFRHSSTINHISTGQNKTITDAETLSQLKKLSQENPNLTSKVLDALKDSIIR